MIGLSCSYGYNCAEEWLRFDWVVVSMVWLLTVRWFNARFDCSFLYSCKRRADILTGCKASRPSLGWLPLPLIYISSLTFGLRTDHRLPLS